MLIIGFRIGYMTELGCSADSQDREGGVLYVQDS